MFEVGFTEIVLILGIALVVLGPEKLPKVAAEIGRWMGRARAMARQLKSQLDEEVHRAERDFDLEEPMRPSPAPRKETPAGPTAAGDSSRSAEGADAGPVPPPGTPDEAAREEQPPPGTRDDDAKEEQPPPGKPPAS